MKIATRIDRMIDKPDTKVKAMASVTFDGIFAVHGIRVIESENGLRAMMPSNSYKDKNGETKYSDVFHAITKEGYEAISKSVIGAYQFRLEQTQSSEIEVAAASDKNEQDDTDECAEDEDIPLPTDEDLGMAF